MGEEFSEFSVDLPAGPGVVQARLTGHVGRRGIWFHPERHVRYGGTVSNRGFRLTRHGNVRNPFKPVAVGRLHPHDHGTLVTVALGVPGLFAGPAVAAAGLVIGVALGLLVVSFVGPGDAANLLRGGSILVLVLFLTAARLIAATNRSQARLMRRELQDILIGETPPGRILSQPLGSGSQPLRADSRRPQCR